MEVKPLKKYKTPAYPEKGVVLRNPNLLKALPERWKGNAKIGIALSSIVMLMLTGCGEETVGNGELTVTDGNQTAGNSELTATDGDQTGMTLTFKKDAGMVAPIFRHGVGRGSFGCVSVAPPAFLSEAEAYEVILEEAKREEIVFEKDGFRLDEVDIPLTSLNYEPEGKDPEKLKAEKGTLELDGYDQNRKIAYEFISREDVVAWHETGQALSSVESYNALGTAERLTGGLDGRTEGNTVAVFYDPMGFDEEIHEKYWGKFMEISGNEELPDEERNKKWAEINRQYENELKETRKAQLREQVKDFLEWLKAQGII